MKAYLDKLAAAEKPLAGAKLAKPEDVEKLSADNLAAEQEVIKKIKDIFSREKKTDHYGGLFNVLVWNNNGMIVKRLDPVGLTFGEHRGIKEKIYTKIKRTLKNVMVAGEGGTFEEVMLEPTNEDQSAIRVKMLENETVKLPGREAKNTTDYLADVQLLVSRKPETWSIEGETGPDPNPDPVKFTYWNYAD